MESKANMKKITATAISGLALLVSNSCANVGSARVAIQNHAESHQCQDSKYDNSVICLKDDLGEAYKSVYQISTITNSKDASKNEAIDLIEGSGMLLEGGYLLTAYHITNPQMDNNHESRTYLQAGKELYALEQVAGDKDLDFMIMKLTEELPNPHPYKHKTGNASELRIGDAAYIIGNAHGFGINMREGIISQLEYDNFLEEDFAVSCGGNYGDSGGPIFALRDGKIELVGIMTMVVPNANKLAYARSINTILAYLEKLMQKENIPIKK